MRQIDLIIIHCTATPEGHSYSVKNVDSWHKARGFSGIGYHFLIGLKGEIWKGRPLEQEGAHTLGQNNHSIGICYVGGLDNDGKPKDTRTGQQKEALLELIKDLKKKYPYAGIHGHYEFANKACPCFDIQLWIKENSL